MEPLPAQRTQQIRGRAVPGAARWAVALAVGATVLVAGCGSPTPSPGAPGGALTSVPGRDVGTAPADPGVPAPGRATARVAPAPQEFVDRAALVAEAVRRAGVPKASSDPVLLSGWALDEGFETNEQKVAWMYGHVSFAPSVDLTTAGSGTLRLPGGDERSVDLIGVRPALDRALDGALTTPVACDGIAAADCHLVVSGVELVDVSVRTSQGEATAPAWRLTIDGLAHTISVLAVADGVLAVPQRQEALPGLPAAWPELHAMDSLRQVHGASVEVGLAGGGCDEGLVAHVVELDDMVVVGGTTPPLPKDRACTLDYASRPALLHLLRPLGTRPVIDIVTGRSRAVGVPAF